MDDRELQRLKKLVPYKILAPTPDEICDEIERLHSIIKEARELLKNDYFEDGSFNNYEKVFELLDKVEENK